MYVKVDEVGGFPKIGGGGGLPFWGGPKRKIMIHDILGPKLGSLYLWSNYHVHRGSAT